MRGTPVIVLPGRGVVSAPGFVLWFTGLSGAGKSTLTAMVSAELERRGVHVEALDGDEVRKNLSKGLGFSKDDRDANIRRLGFVARLVARSGGCAITAAISPYRDVRDEVRRGVERFCEVYCDCPLAVLAERDPKGLYKKALRGEIKNFTGVDDPYEAPTSPELHLHTDQEAPALSAARVLQKLEELGFISDNATRLVSEPGLIEVYGGRLQDRWLSEAQAERERQRVRDLPTLELDGTAERLLAALALGTLSPLSGFMNEKNYLRVSRQNRLENGMFWPAPVVLPLRDGAAAPVAGTDLVLVGRDSRRLALLRAVELWSQADQDPAQRFLAGDVDAFALPSWCEGLRSAREVRAQLTARRQRDVVALPICGVVSRADEYLARAALERADGLLLMPTATPDDSIPLERRLACCELLANRYFASGRVHVVGCALPSAALGQSRDGWLSVAAQNYGASCVLLPEPTGTEELALPELAIRVARYSAATYVPRLGGYATARTFDVTATPGVAELASVAAVLARPELFREDILTLLR